MASNLKKAADKAPSAEAPKAQRASVPFDLKWLLAIVGFVGLTAGSVVLGISVAPIRTHVETREVPVAEAPMDPGPSFNLINDQVVNLKGGGFLRFSMVVQFAHDEAAFPADGGGGHGGGGGNPVAAYEPALKDAALSAVAHLSRAEAADVAVKERLKAAMAKELDHALAGSAGHGGDQPRPRVFKVYFTSWVAQ